MAAQAAPYVTVAPVAGTEDISNFLESSFIDVVGQFEDGISIPKISFTHISTTKVPGFGVWKHHLQSATGSKLELIVNAADNTVSVVPIESMATHAINDAGSDSGSKSASKDKVPRPPNAFIIYRKEWHPVVVRENPGLHNNEVSVIIGRKWKAETEAVKEIYKRKSEDAKRQHAIDHPGYQYQPRKPSEKKKRMTKTKLAKLTAQLHTADRLAQLAVDHQMPVTSFESQHQGPIITLQQSDEVSGHMAIDADARRDMQIREELVAYNNDTTAYGGGHTESSLGVGLQTVNGGSEYGVPDVEVPYDFTFADFIDFPGADATVPTPSLHEASTAEVERQMQIWDDAVGELFFNYGGQ